MKRRECGSSSEGTAPCHLPKLRHWLVLSVSLPHTVPPPLGLFPPTQCALSVCPFDCPAGRWSLAGAAGALHAATGFTSEHASLALQMAVAMAAACTLHVCRASYEALHEKTIWVVVTGGLHTHT